MKQVIVTIETNGEVHIETKGFRGRECQEASADLERALGLKTGEQLLPEMFQAAPAGQLQEVRS